MSPTELAYGIISYLVFLLSTTCHEAAHALAAKLGGDLTAFEGGQVSLNPVPHIRREPFGMVIIPLLGIFMGGGLIGWASAPYDPYWQQRFPKRAAWMSLAGPAANYSLALLAAILIKIGFFTGAFEPGGMLIHARNANDVMDGVALVLSLFFELNLLLGTFNLLPIPPLDGFTAVGLLLPDSMALKMQDWRLRMRGFTYIGLLLGWRIFEPVFAPIYNFATALLFAGFFHTRS